MCPTFQCVLDVDKCHQAQTNRHIHLLVLIHNESTDFDPTGMSYAAAQTCACFGGARMGAMQITLPMHLLSRHCGSVPCFDAYECICKYNAVRTVVGS